MSLYVVERERDYFAVAVEQLANGLRGYSFGPVAMTMPEVVDCNAHDGEWPAYITLPHETAEWEGLTVPVFDGDVERREWEARRDPRR